MTRDMANAKHPSTPACRSDASREPPPTEGEGLSRLEALEQRDRQRTAATLARVVGAVRRERHASAAPGGLQMQVAGDLETVEACWGLVYQAYRQVDLIAPNPQRLHTAPQAVSGRAAVICGQIASVPVATLTTVLDSDGGLPLDRAYPRELDALRDEGRELMEIGLFADRRRQLARAAETIIQLMHMAFFFADHHRVSDFVIGVHPKHAPFYCRMLEFRPYGNIRTYAAVNDHPVVLLRADFGDEERLRPTNPVLQYFREFPVDREAFDQRFDFAPEAMAGSRLEAYLRDRQQGETARAAG